MKNILTLLVLVFALGFAGCHNGRYPTQIILDSDYTPSLRVADFRVTDEFSGWKEDAGGYTTYNDAISLQHLIDGGYSDYSNNGLVEGIYQTLSTPDQRKNQVYVMDFGTPAQATYMYNFKKSRLYNTTAIGYPDSTAIGSTLLGGIAVYAHFGKFFFYVSVMGYASQSTAISDANLFLGFYEKMAQAN